MYRILQYKGNDKYEFLVNTETSEILEYETVEELKVELKALLETIPKKELVVVSVLDFDVDLSILIDNETNTDEV